jgi:hypothetical protein
MTGRSEDPRLSDAWQDLNRTVLADSWFHLLCDEG